MTHGFEQLSYLVGNDFHLWPSISKVFFLFLIERKLKLMFKQRLNLWV